MIDSTASYPGQPGQFQSPATGAFRTLLTAVFLLAAILTGNAPTRADPPSARGDHGYEWAVRDAAVPESGEINTQLVAVEPGNDSLIWNDDRSRVKVVSWMSWQTYLDYFLPYSETSPEEQYVLWVTMAPYVQRFCRDYARHQPRLTSAALERRLKQRLGLDPERHYEVFVELWIDPGHLVRPCVDPEPTDTGCTLDFNDNPPVVRNIGDYVAFYKNLYFKSFRTDSDQPWTGLGYTYDWLHAGPWSRSDAEFGESEFILSPQTPYHIEAAIPTWDYCTSGLR